MAANALRLRRSLALTSSLLNYPKHFSSVLPSVAPTSSPSSVQQNPSTFDVNRSKPNNPSLHFISSRAFSSRARYNNDDMDGDQISPDAILFEGCDYKHWLITIDFPKDPKPSPEEMVETYVQTAAKVLGSVEEAKKKIYACSTTTYHGFQVEVSEEVSEQFKGLPGVVFILPDSYIDPVNKEYGGDKYINGTIIPRPPPVQYGRQGGRFNDRNREYNRPQRGRIEQNNYQNQGDGRNAIPARQSDFPQRDQGNFAPPPPAGGYNQGGGGGYRQGAEGQYGQGGGGGGGYGGQYGQPGGGNYRQGPGGQYGQGGGGGGNYGHGGGAQYGQGGGGGGQYGQGGGGGGSYGQGGGGGGSYGQGGGGGGQYGQGGGGGGGQYGQGGGQYGQGGGGGGTYGQGGGGGQYGQGGGGNYGQVGGQYGQGGGGGYGQGGGQYGENPRFSQADRRRDVPGQQGNYEGVEEAEAYKGR